MLSSPFQSNYWDSEYDKLVSRVEKNLQIRSFEEMKPIQEVKMFTTGFQSELRRFVTAEKFKIAYTEFLSQADENVKTKKAKGSRTPFGFENNREFDGAKLSQHFGQGAPSKTPYLNWWVVSVYYIPENGKIVMGIEEDRYPHIGKMKPLRFLQIGNKSTHVAVFYSSDKDSMDYNELHAKFISVAEEVMRLGLN